MPDINLGWRGDFAWSARGDILTADGDTLTQQRIIRRLLTAVRAYIYHLEYGAGLPQRIGRVARAKNIQALCLAQIQQEDSVAPNPVPIVTVGESPTVIGAYIITIKYYNNEQIQQTLTFDTSTGFQST
jgi:hypothetical protein